MSNHWDDSETMEARIARALIVQEYGDDVDALEYIAADKGWD